MQYQKDITDKAFVINNLYLVIICNIITYLNTKHKHLN